jgi:two-component system nitrogen regulation response regulator GlnG
MRQIFGVLERIAPTDASVLLEGETGTGKDVLARSIHQISARKDQPFVVVDCGAVSYNLIESELFGHERGAFTGATAQRLGKFEVCDGGTIFLDEIGDMTPTTQTKILRVLQEGEIQRVGSSETLKVNVRVLAATNKNLETLVKEKLFREDLYYRLNVVRLRLPPLRERVEDVPQIVDYFLQSLAKAKKTKARKVSPEALAILCRYRWPGNVRELENMIYRSAVITQSDAILPKDLPDEVRQSVEAGEGPTPAGLDALYDRLYEQLKTAHPDNMLALVREALLARGARPPGPVKKAKKPAAKKS